MERTIHLWVGIFVCAGLVAVFILALKVGNASATFSQGDAYTVKADFDNIGGLKVRAPVKSAGVVVGRVDSIDFETKRYVARVGMKIDKRYQFPKDTSVSILTAGLLGEQYVGLEAGGDSAMMKDGDVVSREAHAIRGGPGEADRPVPLQQGGGRRG